MNNPTQHSTDTVFRGDTAALKNVVNLHEIIQPEYFAQEVEKIFRRSWLPIISKSALPQRGSYVVVQVPPVNASVLITRGQDDAVRAFYNICRHRLHKLVPQGQGCQRRFSCGFHGWTYDLDGRLTGVPDQSQFIGLDKSQLGLVPVHCELWEDYVFLNFEDKPRESLREFLGDFYDGYKGYFDDREQVGSWSVIVNANWHITINAFTEGYHSMFLHAKTIPDYQGGKGNLMRHRPFLEVMPKHARYSAKANPEHKMTPVESIAYGHGRKLLPAFPSIDCSGPDFPKGVNPGRVEHWAFDIMELFPGFSLLASADYHQNRWFLPIDADHTEVRVEDYAYKAKTVGDRLAHSYMRVRNREVVLEDMVTTEAIHASLKSGAVPNIILSQQEMLLQKHYATTEKMVSQP